MFNPREPDQDEYGYDRSPSPRAGGILGWLARSFQRSTTTRARRWAYWNVPFLRSYLRYREAGPLGRLGCVVQLLIQVAVMTGLGVVLFNLFTQTGDLTALLP
jgi:hypothetical protein